MSNSLIFSPVKIKKVKPNMFFANRNKPKHMLAMTIELGK